MLFKNITIIDENFEIKRNMYVGTKDDKISVISQDLPEGDFGEVYDGKGRLLMPGLVNTHTHSPMTLLRGYAENLPLERWLYEKVFPFEDRLNPDRAYFGTVLSVAEMLSSGTTSFSDMYFFSEGIMRAVKDTHAKINYSRAISSFTEEVDFFKDERVKEAIEILEKYHGSENGRIKIDMCLHSEYTNTFPMIEQFGRYVSDNKLTSHIHVSETKSEHENCKKKYQKTPTELFESVGILDNPTHFAHCVWVEESDMEIIKKKNVSVASCPASNLKLGSGVCDVNKMLEMGINVTIGTDSASSNNGLDMLREMYLISLLPKGFNNRPDIVSAKQVLKMATVGGALAQGRTDCGLVKEGYKADLVVLSLKNANMYPDFDVLNNVVYSASKSDVVLTMVDGDVLYRDGKYKYIDVEEIGNQCNKIVAEIVKELN